MLLEVRTTEEFNRWFAALRDRAGKVRIQARIDRLSLGNPGHHRSLDGGVCEMKIDCGPGYRVYYARRGSVIIVLLCGGDKSTQQDDIRKAKGLAREL